MREQQSVRLRLRQQIRIWIFASTGTCRPVPVPDSPTQAGSYRHAARRPAGPTGAFRSSEEPTQAGWRTTGKLPVSTGLSPVHLGTGEPTHADSHTGQFRSPRHISERTADSWTPAELSTDKVPPSIVSRGARNPGKSHLSFGSPRGQGLCTRIDRASAGGLSQGLALTRRVKDRLSAAAQENLGFRRA